MKKLIFSLLMGLFCLIIQPVSAYDDKFHYNLSEEAVAHSKLSSYLKDNLGFNLQEEFTGPGGFFIRTPLGNKFMKWDQKKSVEEWMKWGSVKEDIPTGLRALKHFYNPTYGWYQRYLTDTFLLPPTTISAWERAGGYAPDEEEPYFWADALTYYYNALTDSTKDYRDEYFAMTFRSLGQVLHLLEDMGVPAHVRNDAHDPFFGGKDKYESLIKSFSDIVFGYTIPEPPVFNTFDHYFDSDVDNNVYGDGLAEYTNYNFLSNDTIFLEQTDPDSYYHYFVHPNINNTDYSTWDALLPETVTAEDGIQEAVYYIHPDPADTYAPHALVALGYFMEEGYYYEGIAFLRKSAQIDDNVARCYAQKLIPEVISYSAGLLNHFFRGELGVEVGVDAVGNIELTITNESAETINGTLELYWDDEDGVRNPVSGVSWNVVSLETGNELILNPTFVAQEGAVAYMLVFGKNGGTIGVEEGVIGKRFIVDQYVLSGGPNLTDYISIDDELYVYLNGGEVFKTTHWGSYSPITFYASSGNNLRVVAIDRCFCSKVLSSLYLHYSDGRSVKLSDTISASACPSYSNYDPTYQGPWPNTFFDETFIIEE